MLAWTFLDSIKSTTAKKKQMSLPIRYTDVLSLGTQFIKNLIPINRNLTPAKWDIYLWHNSSWLNRCGTRVPSGGDK